MTRDEMLSLIGREDLTPEQEREFEKCQDDYRDEKVKLFVDEFLKPLTPNVRPSRVSSMGNPHMIHTHAEIRAFESNRDLVGSKYFQELTGEQRLVHFTSVPVLLSILRESAVRLYSIDHMDDPTEFLYAAEFSGFNKDWNLDRLRSQLFAMSFVLFKGDDTDEQLDHWRLYGHDGRGVAIVFKEEGNTQHHWINYHLSRIHYDAESLRPYDKLTERLDAFLKREVFRVEGAHETFAKLFAFHKSGIFKTESEVRLLHSFDHGIHHPYRIPEHMRSDMGFDISKSGGESLFTRLELAEAWERKWKSDDPVLANRPRLEPKLCIEKVILGYRYNPTEQFHLGETIMKQSQVSMGSTVPWVASRHTPHFHPNPKKASK